MKTHKKWIKVEEGPDNSTIYYDEDGNKLTRFWKTYEGQPADQASTRSWRNNNPGNHSLGPFAKRNGAIGGAGKIPNPGGFCKTREKTRQFFPKKNSSSFFHEFCKVFAEFSQNFFKKGYFIAGTSTKVLESLLILFIACVKTSLRISKGDLQPVPGLQT